MRSVLRRADKWRTGDVLVILENLACEVEVINGPVRVVLEGLEEGRTGLVEQYALSSTGGHLAEDARKVKGEGKERAR